MSWHYHKYIGDESVPEARKHLTMMTKVVTTRADKNGVTRERLSMSFVGPTAEDVQQGIDDFWAQEQQRAANAAAGHVKGQATKAQKSASAACSDDGEG